MDFTQRAADVANSTINAVLCPMIDERLAATAKAAYEMGRGSGEGDVAFKRIGAGYIGLECGRELGFRYHKYEMDVRGCDGGGTNPGELQRHADAGHWAEEMTRGWLSLVDMDIDICQRGPTGQPIVDQWGEIKQIGWLAARDEKGQARLAGEVDGIIRRVGEASLSELIKPPCVWENKKATDKKWKKFVKEGIKKADPRYYGQLQTNMAYMGIGQTLFSMLNLDNMKFYFELVAFDAERAQTLSDRAVQVFYTNTPYDMPRAGRSEDDLVCKFCNFKQQCWHKPIQPYKPDDPARVYEPTPQPGGVIGSFNPNMMEDPPF